MSAAATVSLLAPAKINLFLHVTGRRPDGYHLLESLVAFADIGDTLTVTAAAEDCFGLEISGPFAGPLRADPPETNLVLRAAKSLADILGCRCGAHIHLDKHLPVASGIGGGSTDAAATLRALCQLWQADPEPAALAVLAEQLGADVPVCLAARPAFMAGIGEQVHPLPALPSLPLLLVNPGVPVSTPAVFKARQGTFTPATGPAEVEALFSGAAGTSPAAFAEALGQFENDLGAPARQIEPLIDQALASIAAQPACLLARMSGSGATCFGLFESDTAAEAAARTIGAGQPGWWVRPGHLG